MDIKASYFTPLVYTALSIKSIWSVNTRGRKEAWCLFHTVDKDQCGVSVKSRCKRRMEFSCSIILFSNANEWGTRTKLNPNNVDESQKHYVDPTGRGVRATYYTGSIYIKFRSRQMCLCCSELGQQVLGEKTVKARDMDLEVSWPEC